MTKENGPIHHGEILPPEDENKRDVIQPERPPTGGALFPGLYLRVLRQQWLYYGELVAEIANTKKEIARAYDAAVDTQIAVAKFQHRDVIVNNEIAKMLHGIEMDASRRDIEMQKMQAEQDNFKKYGVANLAKREENRALELEIEGMEREIKLAELKLSSKAVSDAEKETVFDDATQKVAAMAKRAYAELYATRVAERGGAENLTPDDYETLHKVKQNIDNAQNAVDSDLQKDFPDE